MVLSYKGSRKNENGEWVEFCRFHTWVQLYIHCIRIANWFNPRRIEKGRTYMEFDEKGVEYRYEVVMTEV